MNFTASDELLRKAHGEGRTSLYEHEVYEILQALKICKSAGYTFHSRNEIAEISARDLPADCVFLKIVHPDILHKSEIGAVRPADRVNAGRIAEEMVQEVEKKRGEPVVGVLVVAAVEAESGFGRELLIGARLTREFGPVVTVGLGGIDTELFARELKPGRAAVSFSPEISPRKSPVDGTLLLAKLSGSTRDRKRSIAPEDLNQLVTRFSEFVRHYSPLDPSAPFWITECEVNPFLFSSGQPIPVDGLLRFALPSSVALVSTPVEKIRRLLQPRDICLVGVSAKTMNVGRIILKNLLDGGFQAGKIALVRDDAEPVDGVLAYPSISKLPECFDLMILSIAAPSVPKAIEEAIRFRKAESIVLITGGMGETSEGRGIEQEIKKLLQNSRASEDRGPILLGGNSLGVVSRPGHYDTLFIPEARLPRNHSHPMGKNTALISQSGAYLITRMNRMGGFVPRYVVSTGNQVDLGMADLLEYFLKDPAIDVVGCYVEGFHDGEGLRFAKAAREAGKKRVIVYKAGRTSAGQKAAGGHTASIAGDWIVAGSILSQAGCLIADSFEEWADFIMLSSLLAKKDLGKGSIGAVSNAGYETVGIADRCDRLAILAPKTTERIRTILSKHQLAHLQDVRNPMDLTPMANDRANYDVLCAVAEDPSVDIVVHGCVPFTAAMRTTEPDHPDAFAQLLLKGICSGKITKPVVTVVDGGEMYNPLARTLLEAGLPCFRSMDRAMMVLGRWIERFLSV